MEDLRVDCFGPFFFFVTFVYRLRSKDWRGIHILIKLSWCLWKLALHLLYFNQNEDYVYNSNFARRELQELCLQVEPLENKEFKVALICFKTLSATKFNNCFASHKVATEQFLLTYRRITLRQFSICLV